MKGGEKTVGITQSNTGAGISIPKIQQTGTTFKPNYAGINNSSGNMMSSFFDMIQSKYQPSKSLSQSATVNNNVKTLDPDKSDRFDKFRTEFNRPDRADRTDRGTNGTKNSTDDKIKEQISKILKEDEDVSEETSETGLIDVLKLFEMFGVPQDIAQQMIDSIMPDSYGNINSTSGVNSNIAETVNLISMMSKNDIIPEDIKKALSDFSNKLHLEFANAGAEITGNDSKNMISSEGRSDLLQIQLPETDVYGIFKKAVADYIAEKIGQTERGTSNADNIAEISSKLKTDGYAYISQNKSTETANISNIEEMYKAMKKTTVGFGSMGLNFTTVTTHENPGSETKTSGTGQTVDIPQLLTDMQAETSEALYASNLSLTTDEAAKILDKDAKTLESALSALQNATDMNEIPENMQNIFNNAFAGIANAENTAQALQTGGGNISETLEELSHIIANNIKNGVGMNTEGNANKMDTGSFELKMNLSPKELGDLLIKVSYSKGNVILDIITSNKAAEAGVLNRIADLKESLSLRGVSLTDVEVSSGNFNYSGQNNHSNPNPNPNANAHAQGNNGHNQNRGGNNAFGGFNTVNSEQSGQDAFNTGTINKEAARHEIMMNHLKSQRLLYKTI